MARLSKQAFVGGCISLTGTMLLGPEPNLIHRTDIGRQLPQDLPDLGAGVAQWVRVRLETQAKITLTRVGVPGAASNFSLRVNFRCRLFDGVRTAPVCNRMRQHLFVC